MARRRYSKANPSRRGRPVKRVGKLLAVAVVALAAMVAGDKLGVFGSKPTPDWDAYDGKTFLVTRVVDGDTMVLDCPDDVNGKPTTRVRLWGVDTPETVKPNAPVEWYGPEASAFTKNMAEGRRVRIVLESGRKPRDTYDRLLAWVYLEDGSLLNAELISRGYGYADPRFDHHLKRDFADRQAQAMRDRKGLWQNGTPPKDLPDYYGEGRHKLPK